MSLSNLKKDELKILCSELDISFSPSSKVVELITLIENSKIYKENIDVVKNAIIEVTDEKRKKTEQAENERILNEQKLEIEKLSLLRLDKELELLKLKSASVESKSLNDDVSNFNLENLIKSVKILTIPVPKNVECFNLFFNSLEKAFKTKGVSDEFKAEILLNILGERIGNLMIYVKEEELGDYEKIKSIVLREFQPTPQECLKQFKSAVKLPTENYVQFASRVSSVFEYYIQLRKVKEFSKLCELMVSDQIFNSIPQDLKNHISIKQGESFFTPQELGRECDLFLASKTGSRAEHSSFSRSIVHNDRRKFGKVNFEDRSNKNNSRVFLSNVNSKCIMCHNSHSIFKCEDFKKLPVSDRVGFVKDNNLCFKCLSPNCSAKKCSARNCFCNKPHNKLLHFQRVYDRTVENIEKETSATTRKGEEPKSTLNAESSAFYPSCSVANEAVQSSFSATSTLENKLKRTVLLSTAKFFIRDKNGDLISVRGLLDAGSQSDIMTKECANKLGLKQEKINVIISCLNNSSMTINNFVKAEILNVDKSFNQEFEFLVVDKITDLTPSRCLNVEGQIPSNIKLADNFMVPQKIDCLLGAKWFYHLLRPEKIYMPHSELFFQNSVFGFLASGSVMELNNQKVHCGLIIDDDLNSTMRKFWEVESVELETPKSEEAKFAEEHFVQTHFRDPSGKYVVTIPLKEEPNCLGESRSIALKRLKSVWFKLSRDQNYLNLYKDFINEYERLGHMRDVTHEAEPDISYYMPHHGVYRPEKTSTKLRVVFNASSETTNGTSFNSLQLNGGVVQEDLISIMMRFRKHPFAFTADIEKMYRMIDIHPSQRSLQRIVWKDSELSPVKTFELSTITYGTVSAPFLATRTLIQLAKDEGHNFPLAAPIVKDDFYVDDVLSGAKTLPECIEIQHQLTSLLKRAGMRLHKWCGSHPQLASASGGSYEFSSGETKTLGVIWNSTDDCFCFKVSKTSSVTHTKRTVLSTIAKLFDPLGLLGPVISKAKIFLQKLWLLNLQWDDHLPAEVFEEWDRFFKELQSICYIKINRCILPFSDTQIIELHGFSDASEAAFGAVVYCKSLSSTGDVSINLVASKSRVAPLKKITVPRLELCAAVLLAKLIRRIKSALRLEECKTYYWSDSMIVLSWIKKQPSLLKTFVANRVATIQDLSCHEQWRHVSSEDNPADLISRGVNPSNMLDSHLWWEGPVFLTYGEYSQRQIYDSVIQDDLQGELKKLNSDQSFSFSVFKNSFFSDILSCSNKYFKILHILSFILRFLHNCKYNEKRSGYLTVAEIEEAELILVRWVQECEFARDLSSLKTKGEVNPDSQVKNLCPFIDSAGIMRVGGRLKNSNLPFGKKFPILLPKAHRLSNLIVNCFHLKFLHAGPQQLLYQIRQKFWIVQGRTLCRKIVHSCVICFKAKPVALDQIMGNLPIERVSKNHPFNVSGVDFCGPFYIKCKHQRKNILNKIYVCIFICFVTKAIHLEIVSDMTTDAFIASLKRFFARRGKAARIYSDNGKTFVGANEEFKRFIKTVGQDEQFSKFIVCEGVSWHFIPPRAPHFGGLWEAGVKSFKYYLKRVVGNLKLTYEEFLTIIIQIEGMLNSRPLVPLSEDTDEVEVLTPAHFLIGRELTSVAEPDLTNLKENRLKLWQKITRHTQLIWRKWSLDYLNNMQQRNKWKFKRNEVKIGDLVVLKEDNLPPCKWALGKIIEIIRGKDDRVRVVVVKTSLGVFKRAITKICLLPCNE